MRTYIKLSGRSKSQIQPESEKMAKKVIFKGDCSPEAFFLKVMGDHPSCLESSYVRILGGIVHGQWGLQNFDKNAFRLCLLWNKPVCLFLRILTTRVNSDILYQKWQINSDQWSENRFFSLFTQKSVKIWHCCVWFWKKSDEQKWFFFFFFFGTNMTISPH